ncbi:DUF998 domain-containing protein [Montanilutibacter psychrotolerans]|nr:DUF998 domain-containing protein [Lysobacter psychrotolerans]
MDRTGQDDAGNNDVRPVLRVSDIGDDAVLTTAVRPVGRTSPERSMVAILAQLSLGSVAAFAMVTVVLQWLREDLDWQRAPLSLYLSGAHGCYLQSGYFVLAVALVALGFSYYRALPAHARSAAPLLLFAVSGVALVVTAVAESNLPGQAPTFAGWVHGVAAQAAFLCVTTAMLLQSWRLRGDAMWRGRFLPAFTLAVVAFLALWTLALWRDAPRGLVQKGVIALVLAWLWMAAWWLRRGVPQPAARPGGPV